MSPFADEEPSMGSISDLPKVKQLANTNMGVLALICLNPKVVVFDDVRLTGDVRPCNFHHQSQLHQGKYTLQYFPKI